MNTEKLTIAEMKMLRELADKVLFACNKRIFEFMDRDDVKYNSPAYIKLRMIASQIVALRDDLAWGDFEI